MSFKKVLITGGTGFIGAHVADALLSRDISIVLVTRNQSKAEKFIEDRPAQKHLIQPIIVSDFESGPDKSVFVGAAKGCDGIIHVASPFLAKVTNAEDQLIKPAIAGVRNIMEAAYANQDTVKRVVLTSSFASVFNPTRTPPDDFVYTEKHWNPITYEEGVKGDEVVGYRASKKFAELEAWNFVKEKKPSFDLVTLCPPMVFGPIVHPLLSLKELNVSNAVLRSVALGEEPQSRVPLWIDVRDLAYAHVESLLRKQSSGKRYVLLSPEKFLYAWAAQIIRDHKLSDKVKKDYKGEVHPKTYSLDWQTAQKDLDIQFHGFEDCVVNSIQQFNEIEKREEGA